ncbi:MAG: general secretion pathway protein GspB [Desulfobacterales bacterium]|nr:general secretion pathway protein GspB [Desulfobacterales bacterium]MDX2510711.1 general secretion pathway protein GspB [Desulfobacterales bacterium]
MSSILDSLKKLEKEKSRQDYPPALIRGSKRGFIPKRAIGIFGIVCVCIGAIGFATYYQWRPEKAPEPFIEKASPAAKPEVQETPKPGIAVDEQKTSLASISRDSESKANTSKPEAILFGGKTIAKPGSPEDKNDTGEVKTEERQVVETIKAQEDKPVMQKTLPESVPQPLTKEKNKPNSTDDLPEEEHVQEKKPLPMDRLEGGGFKIQAISWGETPQERLVVISNQVLREGDSIEGYQISHINPDDIVLRRSDKAYRLDFGLKGRP